MKLLLPLFALFCAALAAADDFQDLSARAAAARDANKVPQAIDLYQQALNLNPRWQEGWWFLGTLLYDNDQYAPGRDAFQHFVDLDAQAGPGWSFLGLCEFETGDYGRAVSDIEHGLSLGLDKDPQLGPVLLYHEALLLTKTGDFDKSIQRYSALLRGMQGRTLNNDLVTGIGLASLRSPLLPKEIARDQADLFLAAGKAGAFILMGDFTRAESGFSELLEKYPTAAGVHYMHGVYLLARDPDAAFKEFTLELEISPSNGAAAGMLAWGLLTRGDSELALPYAKEAAEAPQSASFAKYVYGRALVETGQVKRGIEYLQSAEKADSANLDVHVVLAEGYAQLGQPGEARREREYAMRMESEIRPVAQP